MLEDYNTLGLLTVMAVALAGFVWTVLQIVRWFQHKPPLHKEYATKKEVEVLDGKVDEKVSDLKDEFNDLKGEINDRFNGMSKAASEGREKIYTRLNKLDRCVTELKTENRAQSESLKRIDHTAQGSHDRIGQVLSIVGELKGEMKAKS